jgi:hypothetical protein
MQRKMTGLFAALAAFGVLALVPAIGSAHGLLDTSGGVTTTTTGKIVAYNEVGTAWKFIGSGLTIECPEVTLTGAVAANPHTTAGVVRWTIEDIWFGGNESETRCSTLGATTLKFPGCLTNEGGTQHWCLKTVPETESFNVEPHGCGGAGGGNSHTFSLSGAWPANTNAPRT